MIYISSACVKNKTIKESVLELFENGYSNIELSGGTEFYEGLEDDLLELKEKHQLNLICHNYFPPPPKPFVLNLASLDEETNNLSLQHVLKSLELSKKLGTKIYAVHAGFLMDIPVAEIGQKIKRRPLFEKEKALEKFVENLKIIHEAADEVKIYIENNVLSKANYENYFPDQPFFFCDFDGFQEIKKEFDFRPLLDVAHLKVSNTVLEKNFEANLQKINELTDYIHISDNDGYFDTNQHLAEDSTLFKALKKIDLKGKSITLEVYNGLEKIKESYQNVEKLIEG